MISKTVADQVTRQKDKVADSNHVIGRLVEVIVDTGHVGDKLDGCQDFGVFTEPLNDFDEDNIGLEFAELEELPLKSLNVQGKERVFLRIIKVEGTSSLQAVR